MCCEESASVKDRSTVISKLGAQHSMLHSSSPLSETHGAAQHDRKPVRMPQAEAPPSILKAMSCARPGPAHSRATITSQSPLA